MNERGHKCYRTKDSALQLITLDQLVVCIEIAIIIVGIHVQHSRDRFLILLTRLMSDEMRTHVETPTSEVSLGGFGRTHPSTYGLGHIIDAPKTSNLHPHGECNQHDHYNAYESGEDWHKVQ